MASTIFIAWPEGLNMAIPEKVLGKLIDAAKSASEHAYCPYSHFRVGAAVLTDRGEIFAGCNVENASYGLTICAERNAIFHTVAQGQMRINAIVVYTPTPTPSAPCGACRQVINEFGPEAEIICVCNSPEILHKSLSQFLPEAFGPHNLKEHQAPG
jgi:cytidine deaminase